MLNEIENFIEEKLSEKRFKHSKGVADYAKRLANRFMADEEDAYLAGLLHDCAKEISLEEMNEITKDYNLDKITRESKNLMHGPAGAVIAKEKFNINDDVFDACFYHTTGKENMPLLTKIVFVADIIEDSRTFSGVEEIRKTAFENIDKAVVLSINSTVENLIKKESKIALDTIKARNCLL